jgi:hypothetical protein
MQLVANIRTPPRRSNDPDVLMRQGKYVPLQELAAITEKLHERFNEVLRGGHTLEAARACQDCVLAGFTTSIDMPSIRGVCIMSLRMPQPAGTPCEYTDCQHPTR